jgi:hypothetical protein
MSREFRRDDYDEGSDKAIEKKVQTRALRNDLTNDALDTMGDPVAAARFSPVEHIDDEAISNSVLATTRAVLKHDTSVWVSLTFTASQATKLWPCYHDYASSIITSAAFSSIILVATAGKKSGHRGNALASTTRSPVVL